MTREYIMFSVSVENGEANLTNSSAELVAAYMADNPLFAADILLDIMQASTWLYWDARDKMDSRWKQVAGDSASSADQQNVALSLLNHPHESERPYHD